jgi:capsule polysaccharide export protein KpsE/RkpR
MLATLGGINLGALTGASEKNIIALMNSDRLANIVIDEFALKTRWKLASDVPARDRLKKAIKVTLDKNTGFIDVGFTDADPVFAAQVANGLVTGLRKLTGEIALGEAQQKRMILEEQIDKARDVMIRAEFNLRALDQKLGVKTYDSRGELALAQATSMRGQLIALEVQQQSMRTYANDRHPDMLALNAQIAALRSQLTKLEDASGVRSTRIFDGTAVPNAQQVEHAKAVSEARHRASTYEALIRQLEFARAEEARQGIGLIQQIDKAVAPVSADPSRRGQKIMASTGIGFGLGLMIALMGYFVRNAKAAPEAHEKLLKVLRAWGLRPK